jgi:hypothetical protein
MLATGFMLVCGHALGDYALQNDFVAKNKARKGSIPGFWPYVLGSHALMHGMLVTIATGSTLLGMAETLAHALIDFGKCEGWFGINTDQLLHLGCKAVWLWLTVTR